MTGMVLPCLTVIQPWATLIAYGIKRVETRSWLPPASLIGERLAIHAAARWTEAQAAFAATAGISALLSRIGVSPSSLPLGAVVGVVRVASAGRTSSLSAAEFQLVAMASCGDFDHGGFAWILSEAEALSTPFPARGNPGLWSLTLPDAAKP
jgi:hypothetical protein